MFLRKICSVYKKNHLTPETIDAIDVQDFFFFFFWDKTDKQRRSIGYTWSAPEASAAVSICIRLWFPSVLCDHQSSQLILTAVDCSENHRAAMFSLYRDQFSHVF